MKMLISTIALVSCSLVPSWGLAQEEMIGKMIYDDHCSVCHGDGGAGDGLVAALFDQKPKNLTSLAKLNNGVFPFESVYQAIDGRRELPAHGYSRMPIWGDFFMEQALTDRGHHPRDARAMKEGRILAIVYYLQTLQKE